MELVYSASSLDDINTAASITPMMTIRAVPAPMAIEHRENPRHAPGFVSSTSSIDAASDGRLVASASVLIGLVPDKVIPGIFAADSSLERSF